MLDPVLTSAIAWGGPYCGKLLTVAEGRTVIPLEDFHGEYLLTKLGGRPQEWVWTSPVRREQPEDGA